MNEAVVRLTGVTRVYPGVGEQLPVHALGPIDLTLREGEFYTVVGPSGCGKSTLLDLVAGLAFASEGQVEAYGVPVRTTPEGVGVVFQQDASFPWLTVRDNVAFPLRREKVLTSDIKQRVADVLEMVGLSEFVDSFPRQLSGGMRQRVCIARTLVTRPRLLLMDEPFGALDSQTRLLMGDELLDIWRATGASIIFITHALDEAAMLSDRIGVMSARPGRLIEEIETGWSRDRTSKLASRAEFGALTSRLWGLLRNESLHAMGRSERGTGVSDG